MGVGLFAVKRPHDLQWVPFTTNSNGSSVTVTYPLQCNPMALFTSVYNAAGGMIGYIGITNNTCMVQNSNGDMVSRSGKLLIICNV